MKRREVKVTNGRRDDNKEIKSRKCFYSNMISYHWCSLSGRRFRALSITRERAEKEWKALRHEREKWKQNFLDCHSCERERERERGYERVRLKVRSVCGLVCKNGWDRSVLGWCVLACDKWYYRERVREREREDNASTFVCEREMEEEIKMRKCLCVCFTHRSETRSVREKERKRFKARPRFRS